MQAVRVIDGDAELTAVDAVDDKNVSRRVVQVVVRRATVREVGREVEASLVVHDAARGLRRQLLYRRQTRMDYRSVRVTPWL